jgi:hypothetical protein
LVELINKYMTTYAPEFKVVSGHDQYRCNEWVMRQFSLSQRISNYIDTGNEMYNISR